MLLAVLFVLTVVKKQKPEFKSTVRPIGVPTPYTHSANSAAPPPLFPLISHTVGHTVLCPSCSAANRVAGVNVARLLSSRCADSGLPSPPAPDYPPPIADQSTSFQPPPTPPSAAAAPHRLLHLTTAHLPHHNLTDDYTCHSRQHVAN